MLLDQKYFFLFLIFFIDTQTIPFESAGWVGNAFLNNSACTLNRIWLLHNNIKLSFDELS